MADGYGEKRVAWEENRKREKMKEREKRWSTRKRKPLVVIGAGKEKTGHRQRAHHMNIFTKMPPSLSITQKHPKIDFSYSLITQKSENLVMETKLENIAKWTYSL